VQQLDLLFCKTCYQYVVKKKLCRLAADILKLWNSWNKFGRSEKIVEKIFLFKKKSEKFTRKLFDIVTKESERKLNGESLFEIKKKSRHKKGLWVYCVWNLFRYGLMSPFIIEQPIDSVPEYWTLTKDKFDLHVR